jgi:hypothetical protein
MSNAFGRITASVAHDDLHTSMDKPFRKFAIKINK